VKSIPLVVTAIPALLPLLIIGLATPMALGKVRPNQVYGFRTPKTMSSEAIWYQANRLAGINLVVAGAVALLDWAVMLSTLGMQRSYLPGMIVDLVLVVVSGIVSLVQLRRL
jgi:uncharacterized membrane protein